MDHEGPRGNFYEVRTIDVALPRLDLDTPATCPVPYEHILEHDDNIWSIIGHQLRLDPNYGE